MVDFIVHWSSMGDMVEMVSLAYTNALIVSYRICIWQKGLS
jgi:hypothetical protein